MSHLRDRSACAHGLRCLLESLVQAGVHSPVCDAMEAVLAGSWDVLTEVEGATLRTRLDQRAP